MRRVDGEPLLEPERLRRYADAIVRAGVALREGDTLVVRAEPAHRELTVAVVEAAYRRRGNAGWLRHVRAIGRRATKLSRLDLASLELRGPGTSLDLRMAPGQI